MINAIYAFYGQLGRLLKAMEQALFREQIARGRKLPGLTLYHFWVSYYSTKTRRAIYRMGAQVDMKDVLLDQQAYQDLVGQGGKDLVPCLRIETPNGVQWMYESDDIIRYLKECLDQRGKAQTTTK